MCNNSLTFINECNKLIIKNGYICVEVNKKNPCINVVRSDFSGSGSFGSNLLSEGNTEKKGISFEVVTDTGELKSTCTTGCMTEISIIRNDSDYIVVSMDQIKECTQNNLTVSKWIVSLGRKDRFFTLDILADVIKSHNIKSIKISTYLKQWCMVGMYQKGINQYVNNGNKVFSSQSPLHAFYTMDNSMGSIAIKPNGRNQIHEYNMISGESEFSTGLEMVFAGEYPSKDVWDCQGWNNAKDLIVQEGTKYRATFNIYGNNFAFPTHELNNTEISDSDDLKAYYTALYGSAVACLGSYACYGSAYPTLSVPQRTYGNLHNFFDPDSYFTVAVLSFSGDEYLQREARKVIELSERYINSNGQVPHHFEEGNPVYVAISGATQTGPNIFWLMACIEYASGTGDIDWLKGQYGNIKKAVEWILQFYDTDKKLLKVNGPLWEDTFKRMNYTYDTNAFICYLLPLVAEIYMLFNDEHLAERHKGIAESIKQGMESLWDGVDHYITSRGEDWYTTKDMVDYDNYSAIAFKITTDPKRISSIFQRLDSGKNTHPGGKATWVSEKYYDTDDCFLGNTGDSQCAMARIWWVDSMARYEVGDRDNFNKYFSAIRNDLLDYTWLKERYDSGGKMVRAECYHEYPEILCILMRENLYGINIKPESITIKPLGLSNFVYKIGSVAISYNNQKLSIFVPGNDMRKYNIFGLLPHSIYLMSDGNEVLSNDAGTIEFLAPTGRTIEIIKG